MRRMLWVALLAAPAALASAAPVQAQGCASGGCGGPAAFGGRPGFQVPPFGCPFGFCFKLFPGLHQNGPLVNYGPYEGYYPFQPYGPWTSDLRYTGPTGPARENSVGTGWAPGLSGLFNRGYVRRGVDGCGSGCGQYALSTLRNVAARLNPFHRFGCGTGCKSGCN
jgi:hypothetical protein